MINDSTDNQREDTNGVSQVYWLHLNVLWTKWKLVGFLESKVPLYNFKLSIVGSMLCQGWKYKSRNDIRFSYEFWIKGTTNFWEIGTKKGEKWLVDVPQF